MKGVILPGHGNVLEVMGIGNDVDVFIYLLSIGELKRDVQPDYIAICLPLVRYSDHVCGEKAKANGIVFDNKEFAEFEEEMMGSWVHITTAKLTKIAKIGVKKSRTTMKKAAAPSSA